MQYYTVGLYISLIAIYVIGKGKLESLTGTAIMNIVGVLGAYTGVNNNF